MAAGFTLNKDKLKRLKILYIKIIQLKVFNKK